MPCQYKSLTEVRPKGILLPYPIMAQYNGFHYITLAIMGIHIIGLMAQKR